MLNYLIWVKKMIDFSIAISNPFDEQWECKIHKYKKVARHKYIEFQLDRTNNIIKLAFNIGICCDHAGVQFDVGMFGYVTRFQFYDTRHWEFRKGDNNE